MLDLAAIKKRYEAAKRAKPQDGVAALWVRRYREDLPAVVEALEEAQRKLAIVQEWLEPSGVAQHPEVTKARNKLRARIMERE